MTHTPSPARVRIVLVAALAVLTLSSCGQSDESGADRASEPTDSGTTSEETSPGPGDSASGPGGESATTSSGPSGGSTLLVAGETPSTTTTRIISASNVGGAVDPRPVPVQDAASRDELLAPLGADLGRRVRAAVRQTEVPDGQTLMAAVVAVGCDEPTGIELVPTSDGYEVTGVVPKSGVQCLVPVTSVALFLIDTP
jgi:hypothetical protein